MFTAVGARLYFVSTGNIKLANITGSSKTQILSSLRGNIYDCNFEKLVNRKEETVICAMPFYESAKILKGRVNDELYLKFLKSLQNGEVFIEKTDTFDFRNDFIDYSKIYSRYDDSFLACHILGYADADNIGVCGIEKSFDELLKEDNSTLSLKFMTDAKNKLLKGESISFISNNYFSKKGVMLTIDRSIQKICENAMKLKNVDCGACVVLDADNSEIKALSSFPSFDVNNLEKSLNDEKSPFLNRTLCSYSVGSIFKSVVCASAVKYGFDDYSYNCKGSCNVGEIKFSCSNGVSHKNEDLSLALKNSCNTYFINLAMKIGKKKIIDMARNLGFGESFSLCEGIFDDGGYLPGVDDIDTDGALANLSFGQGKLMASPLQIAMCYGALVSDGKLKFPSLVKSTVSTDGKITPYKNNNPVIRALTQEESAKVKKLLLKNMEYENYLCAKPDCDNISGGKTSTAQTGWYDEKNREILHCWFAGFVDINDKTYVIVIFKENGISGANDCAPVFREIANRLIIYNKES